MLSLIAFRENRSVAQLIVRNIDKEIVRLLKVRAAQHGRSAEAEHREILREALVQPDGRTSLKDLLAGMPDVGSDEDFERIQDRGRPVEV